MSKIEKLTPEQEAKLSVYKDMYLDKFFKPEKEVDFEEVKEYVHWLYEFCGLEKPVVLLVDSPMAVIYAYNQYTLMERVNKRLAPMLENIKSIGEDAISKIHNKLNTLENEDLWREIADKVHQHPFLDMYYTLDIDIRRSMSTILSSIEMDLDNKLEENSEDILKTIFDKVRVLADDAVFNQICNNITNNVLVRVYDLVEVETQTINNISEGVVDQVQSDIDKQKDSVDISSAIGSNFYEICNKISIANNIFKRLSIDIDAQIDQIDSSIEDSIIKDAEELEDQTALDIHDKVHEINWGSFSDITDKIVNDVVSNVFSKIEIELNTQLNPIIGSNISGIKYAIETSTNIDNTIWNKIRSKVKKDIHKSVWDDVYNQAEYQVIREVFKIYDEVITQVDFMAIDMSNRMSRDVVKEINKNVEGIHGESLDNIWSNTHDDVSDNAREIVRKKTETSIFEELETNIAPDIESEVREDILNNDKIKINIYREIEKKVLDQIRESLKMSHEEIAINALSRTVISEINSLLLTRVREVITEESKDLEFKWLDVCYYLSAFNSWVSFVDFFDKEVLTLEKSDVFNKYKKVLDLNIFWGVTMNNVCIVSKNALEYNRDRENRLHSIDGPAVRFKDDYSLYFINGRGMDDVVFNKVLNQEYTLAEFLDLENEEDKASVITLMREKYGNQAVLDFLEAVVIDEQEVVHTEDYTETLTLYKTKATYAWANDSKGNTNVELAWLRLVCPSTGQIYLINTCPSFTDVVECAKWHRPKRVPTSVPYKWISAN